MKDGKVHTADELHKECKRNGIEVGESKGDIYNVVHQLKRKGELVSDSEKGYVLAAEKACDTFNNAKNDTFSRKQVGENSEKKRLEFTDFEIVQPAVRKSVKQIISVWENGELALNSALCKKLKTSKVEIHIKKDCSQIILVPGGNVLLDITKNNRIRNHIICEKLEKKRIKFPVYYVGEWDEEKKIWLGDLVMTNPNKNNGKAVK